MKTKVALLLSIFNINLLLAEDTGELILKQNDVFVVRNFETLEASQGYKLKSKDIIVTSYNSSAEISLVDKSSLEVLKNSGCLIDFKNGKNVIEVVKGAVEQTKNGNKKIIGVKN